MNYKYIKKFEDLRITDIPLVGGKNASLGQMIAELSDKGVVIPTGFAVTAQAYWYYLEYNNLLDRMKEIMAQLTDIQDIATLKSVGHQIRTLIEQATMPDDLAREIVQAYHELSQHYKQENCDVAIRSSATAEDLPTASFAGQQETFLNVRGDEQVLENCKKSIASLFTNRAIVYRIEKGFDHFKIALSVGVQKMVRSDLSCSGVVFTLDTESGFKDVIMIESSWGLGESIVKGLVVPDEFLVHKPTLKKGFSPILKKKLGDKSIKIVYAENSEELIRTVPVTQEDQKKLSLNDEEVLTLAQASLAIEEHYSELRNAWAPMDIEWAKDGLDNKIYIIQSRPETVHSVKPYKQFMTTYTIKDGDPQQLEQRTILKGQSIGQQIVSGTARVIESVDRIDEVQKGDILVTDMTDPDWVPVMKRVAGIVTNRGGRTCHAAIVSRELGVPAIVGTRNATTVIKNGQEITIDCSRSKVAFIYDGRIPFETVTVELGTLPTLPVDIMVNLADPDSAFTVSFLPVDGVGLARVEFIISNTIKIHPMALVHPERIEDANIRQVIDEITFGYTDKKDFFVERLAQGIGTIAAAFYPKPVIVRLSDFKSNEYRNLIGGTYFEPIEENPMLGFRGAFRYYHEHYQEAFALECAAFKRARDYMGLTNIKVMVPFVRTLDEAQRVIQEMERHGLQRNNNGLTIIMMCEVPSNVLLIDEFSQLFDGFSIGSNDLTQLTLGVDRDSELLAGVFDERDPAVKKMLAMAVEGAKRNKRYSGICGQAPSDYPEIAQFLIDEGIDSLSLNSDSVLPFLMRYQSKP